MKKELLKYKRGAVSLPSTDDQIKDAILSPLEEMRQKYRKNTKRRDLANREEDTMDMLASFQKKIRSAEKKEEEEEEGEACALHSLVNCKSCKDTFGQKDTSTDQGWLAHELSFKRDVIDANLRRDDVEDLVRQPSLFFLFWY